MDECFENCVIPVTKMFVANKCMNCKSSSNVKIYSSLYNLNKSFVSCDKCDDLIQKSKVYELVLNDALPSRIIIGMRIPIYQKGFIKESGVSYEKKVDNGLGMTITLINEKVYLGVISQTTDNLHFIDFNDCEEKVKTDIRNSLSAGNLPDFYPEKLKRKFFNIIF